MQKLKGHSKFKIVMQVDSYQANRLNLVVTELEMW